METLKAVFSKPDPQAQVRKCNALIRQNVRKLDRDIATLRTVEAKTKSLILAASRRARLHPAQAAGAEKEVRVFARELLRIRKQSSRLITSKAQLNSVAMQVTEAFAVRKIEGSIRASTGIMRDVNSLVRLPELTGTMRELGAELVKAGIIEEMVDDMLPEGMESDVGEDEAEAEVDKVLGEVLQGKMATTPKLPDAGIQAPPQAALQEEDEEDEDPQAMLDQMRGRLEALKS